MKADPSCLRNPNVRRPIPSIARLALGLRKPSFGVRVVGGVKAVSAQIVNV